MNVVLTIGKILLIVLAVVLALVLLLLIVPVSYQGKLSYKDELKASGRVKILFGIINIKVEDSYACIYIFGIKICRYKIIDNEKDNDKQQ